MPRRSPKIQNMYVIGACLFAWSCGEPSPWANLIHREPHNLTERALDQLGSPQGFEPFNVGLISDPQILPGFLKLAVNALDDRGDISFSLILGDLTDRSLRAEFLWVADVVEKANHPVLTVVGNHDGLIYGEDIYKRVFGPLNYTFTFRGVKFVMWNNNPFEWGYPDFDWLRREIETYPHVIIVAHQPPGSIERYPEANDELRSIYAHPHVLGSLHGHTHKYGFELISDKPVLTVARVVDTTFSVMKVKDSFALSFEHCQESRCQNSMP